MPEHNGALRRTPWGPASRQSPSPRPGAPRHGPRARMAAPAQRAAWPLANTMACLPPPSLQVAASLARIASGRGAPWPARAAPRARPSRASRKSPGSLRAGCPLPPCASAVQLGLLAELLTELPAHPPARPERSRDHTRTTAWRGCAWWFARPGPRFRRAALGGCGVVYGLPDWPVEALLWRVHDVCSICALRHQFSDSVPHSCHTDSGFCAHAGYRPQRA